MKKLLIFTSMLVTMSSCVNSDFYSTPTEDIANNCSNITGTANAENLYLTTPTSPTTYSSTGNVEADILEGYVTSSDEGGNFYKSISMVTFNPTTNVVGRGFTVSVDATNTSNTYEPGRKVYIKLNGRKIMSRNSSGSSSFEIGSTDIENPSSRIGRLNPPEIKEVLVRGCEKINEDRLVQTYTVSAAKNNANLNKLIEINNIQFTDASIGKKYYDESVFTIGGATNHEITDNTGNKVTVRVSSFCSFAGELVNLKNGTIRGVMTKFGSGYQLMIRSLSDVKMTNTRFDSSPPLVGTALVNNATLNEPFTSYNTTNQQNFPAYINDAVLGTRYWQVKTFGGNKYIQMSSFGGTAEINRSLFIVPIDLTAASTLAFKTKAGFANGTCLKVYYSTNYTPGSDVNLATLTDITSSFTIDAGSPTGYPANFTNSGNWNLPGTLTGNGYIIFEYKGNGSGGVTTTMQIDDIVIN